jgi:hypothetical protein
VRRGEAEDRLPLRKREFAGIDEGSDERAFLPGGQRKGGADGEQEASLRIQCERKFRGV